MVEKRAAVSLPTVRAVRSHATAAALGQLLLDVGLLRKLQSDTPAFEPDATLYRFVEDDDEPVDLPEVPPAWTWLPLVGLGPDPATTRRHVLAVLQWRTGDPVAARFCLNRVPLHSAQLVR